VTEDQALAKALIDAGLFKVLGLFISTPFGVLIIIEVLKFFGFRKDKKKQDEEKEEFKCKLYSAEQALLREYICKFDDNCQDQLSLVSDKAIQNNVSLRQLLSDLRDDRKVMVQLIKIISKKLGVNADDV